MSHERDFRIKEVIYFLVFIWILNIIMLGYAIFSDTSIQMYFILSLILIPLILIGLWKRKEWGLFLCYIISIFFILEGILSLNIIKVIVWCIVLYYLYKSKVFPKEYFTTKNLIFIGLIVLFLTLLLLKGGIKTHYIELNKPEVEKIVIYKYGESKTIEDEILEKELTNLINYYLWSVDLSIKKDFEKVKEKGYVIEMDFFTKYKGKEKLMKAFFILESNLKGYPEGHVFIGSGEEWTDIEIKDWKTKFNKIKEIIETHEV